MRLVLLGCVVALVVGLVRCCVLILIYMFLPVLIFFDFRNRSQNRFNFFLKIIKKLRTFLLRNLFLMKTS